MTDILSLCRPVAASVSLENDVELMLNQPF